MIDPVRPPSLAGYANYLAAQVYKTTQRVLSAELAEHDLRLYHFAILAALDDLGPRSQQELCDALDVEKSHICGFVEDLHTRDLVTRERDPDDRRRYRLAATDEGRAVLADLHDAQESVEAHLFSHLPAEDRAHLTRILTDVVDHLDAARLSPVTDRTTSSPTRAASQEPATS